MGAMKKRMERVRDIGSLSSRSPVDRIVQIYNVWQTQMDWLMSRNLSRPINGNIDYSFKRLCLPYHPDLGRQCQLCPTCMRRRTHKSF